jgi:hypothetical protein
MGRIGEPKREIHIPVIAPAPVEEPAPAAPPPPVEEPVPAQG